MRIDRCSFFFKQKTAYEIPKRDWSRRVLFRSQGQGEEGIAQILQGLAAYQNTGAQSGRSLVLGLLAETYKNTARPDEGLTVVSEALTLVQNTGQRSQESWLWRIRGELFLQVKVPGPKFKM